MLADVPQMTGDWTVAFARFGPFGKKVRATKPADYLKILKEGFSPLGLRHGKGISWVSSPVWGTTLFRKDKRRNCDGSEKCGLPGGGGLPALRVSGLATATNPNPNGREAAIAG